MIVFDNENYRIGIYRLFFVKNISCEIINSSSAVPLESRILINKVFVSSQTLGVSKLIIRLLE